MRLRTLQHYLRDGYDGLEEEDRLAKRKAQCVAMADNATNHMERGNQLDLIHVRSSVLYGNFESRPGSNGRLIIVGVGSVGGDGNVVVPGLDCRFRFHDRPSRPPNCEAIFCLWLSRSFSNSDKIMFIVFVDRSCRFPLRQQLPKARQLRTQPGHRENEKPKQPETLCVFVCVHCGALAASRRPASLCVWMKHYRLPPQISLSGSRSGQDGIDMGSDRCVVREHVLTTAVGQELQRWFERRERLVCVLSRVVTTITTVKTVRRRFL